MISEDNKTSLDINLINDLASPQNAVTDPQRRDFLKKLGFSVAAASLAASCAIPERKSVPYVKRPEEIVPGMASYYATVFNQGGQFINVMVKNREGRPIKIESNPNSVISKGGTTALAQASIASLYDSKRFHKPKIGNKQVTWAEIDSELIKTLENLKATNKKVALVTSSIPSPSSNQAIFEFTTKYPNVYHVVVDQISYSGLIDATEQAFGVATLPNYAFDQADVVVSIGCDFATSWLNPEKYSHDFTKRRKVSKESNQMNQLIQIETITSPTSALADYRFTVSASDLEKFAADLFAVMNGGSSNNAQVMKVADLVSKAKSSGKKLLFVNGSSDVDAQIMTYALNNITGSLGSTVLVGPKVNLKQGKSSDLNKLVNDLATGQLSGIISWEVNPVYALAFIPKFEEKYKNLEFTLALDDKLNETTNHAKFICPTHHYLESWNDYELYQGIYSLQQPLIHHIYDTRQGQETLLRLSGNSTLFYDYIKNTAKTFQTGAYKSFDDFWLYTLQNGESGQMASGNASFNASLTTSSSERLAQRYPKTDIEVKLYQSVHGDGSLSDNPFVQELPDPITRMTWDNYFIASTEWCIKNNLMPILNEKKYALLTLSIQNKEVTLPVVPMSGVAFGSFGIKYGFGRRNTSNQEYENGYNARNLIVLDQGAVVSTFSNVKLVNKSQGYYEMGSVQSYFTLTHEGLGGEKTRYLIKETTLSEYQKDPEAGNQILGKPRKEWMEHHLVTLYPEHEFPGHKWAMSIDLNSCTGCGACVVACNVENNVPVVGKNEVFRSHDMHWLRIDRYETVSDSGEIQLTFQPMLCQHCENAPCENVCPVSATNHSSEGLNQMAYNRCIGTRYCANNCPYKVRRFNWFDYMGSDSFGAINDQDSLNRLDPIARMMINPDVVTRSRGVIEKCSFCVQKIQEGKLNAKKENRTLKDGDIVTACQAACSTGAIVFGDVNNKSSKVYSLIHDERSFGVIEEIYTKPAVNYLTKVRNKS